MIRVRGSLVTLLDSADMARAYALAAFGVTFSSFVIEHTAGLATLATMIVVLCIIGAAILWVRRIELSWLRFMPTTLMLFVAWAGVTIVLPESSGESGTSWLALVGYTFIATVIAHTRDSLQTVRALGDVLRVLLAVSLALEIMSGILLDMPFVFLDIQGNIAAGGPLQGVFGTRNMLGFVAVIAIITFVTETRTFSIPRGLGLASITLAVAMAALSASPTVFVLVIVTGVATLALYVVRKTKPEQRRATQMTLGITVVLGLLLLWLLRRPVTALLGAGTDFSMRTDLWDTIRGYIPLRLWQGFGWRGPWTINGKSEFPYTAINATGEHHGSALNAYLDVALQLGGVGLVLLVVTLGVALVRSWFVASERKSVLFAWTPLVLVTLLTDGMFESFPLVGAPWILLALCAVRAGQSKSWRERVHADRSPETDTTAG